MSMKTGEEKAAAGHDLRRRLGEFGGDVVRLVGEFPESREAKHVGDQLLRSATAPGAHYSEARCAQSRNDFIHKTALAAKEAAEALHWLRVARSARLLDRQHEQLLDEANQLTAILFSSVQTARKNRKR